MAVAQSLNITLIGNPVSVRYLHDPFLTFTVTPDSFAEASFDVKFTYKLQYAARNGGFDPEESPNFVDPVPDGGATWTDVEDAGILGDGGTPATARTIDETEPEVGNSIWLDMKSREKIDLEGAIDFVRMHVTIERDIAYPGVLSCNARLWTNAWAAFASDNAGPREFPLVLDPPTSDLGSI